MTDTPNTSDAGISQAETTERERIARIIAVAWEFADESLRDEYRAKADRILALRLQPVAAQGAIDEQALREKLRPTLQAARLEKAFLVDYGQSVEPYATAIISTLKGFGIRMGASGEEDPKLSLELYREEDGDIGGEIVAKGQRIAISFAKSRINIATLGVVTHRECIYPVPRQLFAALDAAMDATPEEA